MTYPEAVDIALCYGWIDGHKKSLDATHFLQKFTPRRKASTWSKINVDKVAVLTEQGRMREAGLAEVERAKRDGRWEKAYKSPKDMEPPADFVKALEGNKNAKRFFDGLGRSKKYGFSWRIETAKREETRKKRIDEFVKLLAEGKTL